MLMVVLGLVMFLWCCGWLIIFLLLLLFLGFLGFICGKFYRILLLEILVNIMLGMIVGCCGGNIMGECLKEGIWVGMFEGIEWVILLCGIGILMVGMVFIGIWGMFGLGFNLWFGLLIVWCICCWCWGNDLVGIMVCDWIGDFFIVCL